MLEVAVSQIVYDLTVTFSQGDVFITSPNVENRVAELERRVQQLEAELAGFKKQRKE